MNSTTIYILEVDLVHVDHNYGWESAEILISIIRRPKPIDYRLKSAEVIRSN